MSDSGSTRNSVRVSTLLNRPHIAPMGPRSRTSSRTSHLILEESITSPLQALDTQEFGLTSSSASPIPMSPSSSIFSSRSDPKSLPAVSEEPPTPVSPDTAPAYDSESQPAIASTSTSQVTSTIPNKVIPSPSPVPRVAPPEAVKFDTTHVPWKGMPLEAVLWTVNSEELQDIVSRAIRSSSKESFVRLLTVENLDTVLPAELQRLEALKAVTQSKYRFLVHRRTMLFHALSSSSAGQHHKEGDSPSSVIGTLAVQLAETVAECEQQLQQILDITDQIAQINKLVDVHWAGALAIALRKLNSSYARRTSDLKSARERITHLEAELEDAWKEAENMARELDDYEDAIARDNEEAIIEAAEVVPVPKTPTISRRSPIAMTPTLIEVSPMSQTPIPTTPKTPLSPLTPSHQSDPPPTVRPKAKEVEVDDAPDTVSIKSTRSTRSAKSHRSGRGTDANHSSHVHAARKRSLRASESSLRIRTGHSRKQSSGRSTAPCNDEQPPLPDLPLEFSSSVMDTTAARASSTMLDLSTSPSPGLRRTASLDTVRTCAQVPSTYQLQSRAADDLYLRSPLNNTDEIQLVSRTPQANQLSAAFSKYMTAAPRPPPKDNVPTTKSIPSIWMNADALKLAPTPTPQPPGVVIIETVQEPEPVIKPIPTSKSTTYSKLRTLTKRYSVSLPMFTPRSISRPISRRSD